MFFFREYANFWTCDYTFFTQDNNLHITMLFIRFQSYGNVAQVYQMILVSTLASFPHSSTDQFLLQ